MAAGGCDERAASVVREPDVLYRGGVSCAVPLGVLKGGHAIVRDVPIHEGMHDLHVDDNSASKVRRAAARPERGRTCSTTAPMSRRGTLESAFDDHVPGDDAEVSYFAMRRSCPLAPPLPSAVT